YSLLGDTQIRPECQSSNVNRQEFLKYIAIDMPAEIRTLVRLCKTEMSAAEVWLFGSRARGDNSEDSDWDILAVIPDDAPSEIDAPAAAFRIRRRSGAFADLLTARARDFEGACDVPNTISYAVFQEGIRLDT